MTAAARILLREFPQIEHFDDTGLTTEQVHYFLGESAAIAYYTFKHLQQSKN